MSASENTSPGERAVPYGSAPLRGRQKALHAEIYLPGDAPGPFPVLVWFHSGAFRTGRYDAWTHRAMARWLTGQGIAVAVPEYRLAAVRQDLSPAVQAKMPDLLARRARGFRRDLSQARSLAALEDSVRFLAWLEARRAQYGLAGPVVLGGSSAGAINAFNIAFTAPFLGLERPRPGGILSYSGGYAYPSLYRPATVPVLAAHNPDDARVSIDTIRRLKAMDPEIALIETSGQAHGETRLFHGESRQTTYLRIAGHVQRMSGLDAA